MSTMPEVTLETLGQLAPRDVEEYVRARGWEQFKRVGNLMVYNRPEPGVFDQVLVPIDPTRPDFSERMWDALQKLASFESRALPAIFSDLLHYDSTRGNGSGARSYQYEGLTRRVIGVFYEVYNELGHGFLESVYHEALTIALIEAGLHVGFDVPVAVWFRGRRLGDFSADLLVEDVLLLEIKAVRALESAHEAQLLNYLRATECEIGLLLNFGPKPQVKRMAFDNARKKIKAADA